MKQITLIILVFTFSMSLNAQEKEKQREVGITFSSFDNFGFTYKTGTSNSLWRFNTILISGYHLNNTLEDSVLYGNNGFGATLKLGKEFRKKATENLEFRLGVDISYTRSYSKNKITEYKRTYYSPGINLVFGLNYIINKDFIIGAEILPGINYYVENQTNNYTSGINFGLTNNSTTLSLAYRF